MLVPVSRSVLTLILLFAGAGCGARSGLLDLESEDATASPVDSGRPPIDARPDRTTVPDASTSSFCELTPAGGPANVFEDVGGAFDRPQAVFRDGFEAIVSFTAIDDDRISDARVRSVIPGMAVAAGPVTTLASAAQSVIAESFDGRVTVCERLGDSLVVSERTVDYGRIWSFEVRGDECLGLGGSEFGWALGFRRPLSSGGSVEVAPLFSDGSSPRLPQNAFRPQAESFSVTSTSSWAGIWAGNTLDRIQLAGWRTPEDDPEPIAVIETGRPLFPAIAPWPFEDGAVAIAWYEIGDRPELSLVAVAADGRELLRVEGISFTPDPLFPPSLVATPAGLVIASLNVFNMDLDRARVETFVIGPAGEVRAGPTVPTRFNLFEPNGGIDAVSNGNGRVMVHWADIAPDLETVTRAMFVDCVL